MKISNVYIYPLKGGAAVELKEAEVTEKGLKHDRILMVVDPKTGIFVTQRENPKLALVKSIPTDTGITFSAPGTADISVTFADLNAGQEMDVKLWEEKKAEGLRAPPAASQWLSDVLEQDVVLVYQPDTLSRATDPDFSEDGKVSFADGFPLLLAFTASLEDLNKRIGTESVEMNRFRPNIVIESNAPWEEDTIASMAGSEVFLSLVKPCTRCKVTTIDQQKGVVTGKEPLKTLASFRFSPKYKGTLFAVNAVPQALGQLKAGEKLKITKTKDAPQFVVRRKKMA